MPITGGFGMTMDIKTGAMRKWTIGPDGVKRWYDNGDPVDEKIPLADCDNCHYKSAGKYRDGHCYMFKKRPGERCGQFRSA